MFQLINKIKELFFYYFEKILQLQKKDWNKIVYLSILNFFGLLSGSFGIALSTTFFLKRYGIKFLPNMYVYNAVITSVLTIFYFLLVSSKVRKKIFYLFFSFFIPLIISARILIEFNLMFVYPLIYIIAYLCSWMFYTQFWSLALDICNVREGKRIFSIIVCAGLIGGITGGTLIRYLAAAVSIKNLLIVWLFPLAIVLYILKRSPNIAVTEQSQKIHFKNYFNYFRQSKLIKLIALTFIFYSINVYILDFQFNFVMNNNFKGELELVKFFGNYTEWFYIITFLIELFITVRLVKWIGVGNAMMFFPAVVFAGFTGLVLYFNYYTALFTRLFRDIVGYSIIESTYPLLFTPILLEFRSSAIFFIEGFIIPLGMVFAGIFLVNLQNLLTPREIAFVAASLSLIWFYLTTRLKKVYVDTFAQNILQKGLEDKNFLLEQSVNIDKAKVLPILKKALMDKNDKVNIMAAELLGELKHKHADKVLIDFLIKSKPRANLRATIIRSLGKLKKTDDALIVSKYLDDADPRVRANAVEALSEMGNPEDIIEFIEPCINDSNPRVRINAAILFWRANDKERSKEIFYKNLNDIDDSVRVRTVYALSMIATGELESLFYRCLKDTNQRVRLYALRGLGKIGSKEALQTLIYILGKEKRFLRAEAGKILKEQSEKSVPVLIQNLIHPEQQLRHKAALVLAETGSSQSIEPLLKYCEREIYRIYEYLWKMHILSKQEHESFFILFSTLNTRIERIIIQVLEVISRIENSEILSLAVKRLKGYDETNKAAIVEIMDSLPYGQLIKLIIPLIENTNLEQKVTFGRKKWNFYDFTTEEILYSFLNEESDLWLKLCGIYIVGEMKYNIYADFLKKDVQHPVFFIKEAAQSSLIKIGNN